VDGQGSETSKGEKNSYFLQKVQSGSEVHQANYSMAAGVLSWE
jgi:hypothetical protein